MFANLQALVGTQGEVFIKNGVDPIALSNRKKATFTVAFLLLGEAGRGPTKKWSGQGG